MLRLSRILHRRYFRNGLLTTKQYIDAICDLSEFKPKQKNNLAVEDTESEAENENDSNSGDDGDDVIISVVNDGDFNDGVVNNGEVIDDDVDNIIEFVRGMSDVFRDVLLSLEPTTSTSKTDSKTMRECQKCKKYY
jgi:hypothetical protein